MHMQDTRAIAQADPYTVHAQRCEVMFRCGQAIGLHPVSVSGHLQMFLRATQHDGLVWIVFDLRHLAPEIEGDMLRLPTHDHHGIVFYTLRSLYPTRALFLASMQSAALHSWWPLPGAQQQPLPLQAA